MKNKITSILALAVLCSCATTSMTSQQRVEAALQAAVGGAAQGAINQAISGNTNVSAIGIAAALNGAAALLRSLESTRQASQPAAIANAVSSGANVPIVSSSVAPVIASVVPAAVKQGVPADSAIESAAVALDAKAASVR